MCPAPFCPRTLCAKRYAVRKADPGSQIHQSLVEVPGPFYRRNPLPIIGKCRLSCCRGLDILPVFRHPCENTQQISVYRYLRLLKRNGCNRRRRVRPDSRELYKLTCRRRHFPAIFLHDHHGSLVKIPYSGIISESFPKLQVNLLRCRCKSCNVRQLLQKTKIIGFSRLYPCLLKHDLREPDMIRRRILPPGQDSPFCRVPRKELLCLCFICRLFRFCHFLLSPLRQLRRSLFLSAVEKSLSGSHHMILMSEMLRKHIIRKMCRILSIVRE